MALKPLMGRWRSYAAAVLIALAVAGMVYGVLSATVLGKDDVFSQGTRKPLSEDDVVVAEVGGQPILLSEFTERLKTEELNELYVQRQIDLDTDFSKYLKARQEKTAGFGAANAALGGLILESALFQRAIQLGYAATSSEVRDATAGARDAVEQGIVGPQYQDFVATVGEDRFWDEIYPVAVYRTFSIEKMRGDLASGEFDLAWDPAQPAWLNIQEQVLAETDVVLIGPEKVHPATLDGAVGLLEAVRVLTRSFYSPDS